MISTQYSNYEAKDFTFSKVLSDQARRNGDKTFLTFVPDGRTYSYREIDLASNRVANGLLAAGIGKGHHVAMLMENSPEQVLAYFALAKIGAVVVPINTAARGSFLEYYLINSDSTALVVDQSLLEHALAVERRDRIAKIFVVAEPGTAELTAEDAFCTLADFRTLERASDSPPGIDVKFSDICSIMYTSGTTGPSKGNIFSHIHALSFALPFVPVLKYDENDVYYLSLPLFHAAAYNGGLLLMLMVGGSAALTRRFSISNFWTEVRATKATISMILSMGHFLMAQPPSPDDRNNHLRLLISAPMLPNAAAFEQRFGPKLTQGYGLSDYCCAFSQPLNIPDSKRMSMGRPLEGVDVRLVDDDDNEVPTGEIGEICLRKNDMPFAAAQGYYRMPEATLAATRNLWFHTGDRGRRDEDGYYYFVDRKKDAIRRRGENISTYEVETAIAKHHAIADVAVYPIKIASGEDEVGTSVVLHAGELLSEEELFGYCKANMPHYMVPRFIEFRSALPRTLTDKVRKQEMREHVESNLDSVWDCERVGLSTRDKERMAVQVRIGRSVDTIA